MKLVDQTRLFLPDPRTDKVYEVDLCEVGPDQWVVGFRYGPRGSALREGSRTPVPVSEAEARRVFERLVASKRAKGYLDSDPGPGSGEPTPGDDRDEVLRRYLVDPELAWTTLDGVIVRVGELRVPGCTDRLVALLSDADDRRAYNVVRALLRCGDASAVPALQAVWESSRRTHVRNLAAHAIVEIGSPAARERLVRAETARIPPVVWRALVKRDHGRVERELREHPRSLERLYLIHTPEQRADLLALLSQLDIRPPFWQSVRGIYRAAEARSDGPVFGAVVRRLHQTTWGTNGFGWATREYFVRRSWRILYRLGAAGRFDDFTALAAGVLLAVRDEDGGTEYSLRRTGYRYDPRSRSYRQIPHWEPPRARSWSFNHILYRHSAVHFARWSSLSWSLPSGVSPDEVPDDQRTEAWPEAWDAHPDRLVDLLTASRSAAVHRFGALALAANPSAWPDIELEQLDEMLAAPYPRDRDAVHRHRHRSLRPGQPRPRPRDGHAAQRPRAGTGVEPGLGTAGCRSLPGRCGVRDADRARPVCRYPVTGARDPHRRGGFGRDR